MNKKTDEVNIAVMASQVSTIKDDVKGIKDKLERDYVTQDQFEPIKKLVYGVVALVLTGVVLAILALVIRK